MNLNFLVMTNNKLLNVNEIIMLKCFNTLYNFKVKKIRIQLYAAVLQRHKCSNDE